MQKQSKYGVAAIDQNDYVTAAAEASGGRSRIDRPLLKFGEKNSRFLSGEFTLPDAKERKDPVIEVAHRIVGFALSRDMFGHMPASKVTSDMIGQLFCFYPFSFHKRFGLTYTDRICPASTRTGRCPICDGRIEIYKSDAYRNDHTITKEDVTKGGFWDRQCALFFSRVFMDGEDLGFRANIVHLTNPEIKGARRDKFFDLIADLMTPKKLLSSDTLPRDYYADGDGARWLICEYRRELYEDKGSADGQRKFPPSPFWKISKITPAAELPGIGKAKDIWWPEVGKEDGAAAIDVYDLLNHTPPEELKKAADDKVAELFKPKGPKTERIAQESPETRPPPASAPKDKPTWAEIVAIEDPERLALLGESFGGDFESLSLAGTANISAARRAVAKLCGVSPRPVADEESSQSDDDSLPF